MKRRGARGWTLRRGWVRDLFLERRTGAFVGVTTRALGDMKDPARFARALRGAGLDPRAWAGGEQVHGRRVLVARRPTPPRPVPGVDGAATDVPALVLRAHAADCVPVFLLDPAGKAVALVHAGWRGARRGILTRAVTVLRRTFGVPPVRLWVALGPHIRSCCYEVGPEVARRFRDVPGALRPGEGGRSYLDLSRCLAHEARRAGVRRTRVRVAPHCTAHDRRFYSYRRDKTEKRLAAVTALMR